MTNCIVTMFDNKYYNQGRRLLHNIRQIGKYKGTIVVLYGNKYLLK